MEDASLQTRYNFQYEIGKGDLDVVYSRVFRLVALAQAVFEERMHAMDGAIETHQI